MQTMTLEQFQQALRDQRVLAREDFAVMCPMCRTVQSARDLIGQDLGSGGGNDVWMNRAGKKSAGRLLHGRTWDEVPS